MNTCFHSTVPAPNSLPPIGTKGDYVMPPIILSSGEKLAPEVRYPVIVIGHIGTFGLHLREIGNPRLEIETHFSCFEAYPTSEDTVQKNHDALKAFAKSLKG